MPDSFDGLGSHALASAVTGDMLSLSYCLAVTAALLLLASGLTMRAWLKVETGNPRIALWGAIAYMAAPIICSTTICAAPWPSSRPTRPCRSSCWA